MEFAAKKIPQSTRKIHIRIIANMPYKNVLSFMREMSPKMTCKDSLKFMKHFFLITEAITHQAKLWHGVSQNILLLLKAGLFNWIRLEPFSKDRIPKLITFILFQLNIQRTKSRGLTESPTLHWNSFENIMNNKLSPIHYINKQSTLWRTLLLRN